MNNRITANYDSLVEQAPQTVNQYLRAGIRAIDGEFGEGYAKAHPELLSTFIRAAAQDYHSATLVQALQDVGEEITGAIRSSGRSSA